MRLIDAESIMHKITDMLNESGNPLLAEKAITLVAHEPTAFDKRKVVEKLENLKNNEKKYWEEMDDEDAFGAMCAYAKAIIVVNKGGLNECKNIFKRQRSELIDHKGIS